MAINELDTNTLLRLIKYGESIPDKDDGEREFLEQLIDEHNARRAYLVVNLIEGALWGAVVTTIVTYFI